MNQVRQINGHTRLIVTVMLSAFGLTLTLGMVAMLSAATVLVSAESLDPDKPFLCSFSAVTVTAADLGAIPGISDTLPGSPEDRTLYLANHRSGIITVSAAIAEDGSCYVWGSPAFSRTQVSIFDQVDNHHLLTYAVDAAHGPDTIAITSSYFITGSLQYPLSHRITLTFTPDVTPPPVTDLGIARTSAAEHLYPVSTTLYYTDTRGAGEFFSLTGRSSDEGSGLRGTTFAPADLGCGTVTPDEQTKSDWSVEYCLRNLPLAGVLSATSYDFVGNGTPVIFAYEPDLMPPRSVVTATGDQFLAGTPIDIAWAADDDGCGVETVSLHFRVGEGGWTLSGDTATSATGTFAFKPPVVSLTGPVTYELASVASDHLRNVEGLPAIADDRIIVRPAHLYLPLVTRGYHRFSNGNFESGLNGWHGVRGPFAGHGSGPLQTAVSFEGNNRALLGEPNAQDGHIRVGYGYLAQTFTVDESHLRMQYRVMSYDIVKGGTTQRYFDSFEISMNRPPDQISDEERNEKGCATTALNPEETLVVLQDGLVFCGGRAGTSSDLGTIWDSGWRTVRLDLSAFYGENVTLYLSVWNREYESPYYDDQGWYNTWAYVDNVSLQE